MKNNKKPRSGIDLNKMQKSLDKALANETSESLKAWLKSKGLENEPLLTDQQFVVEYERLFPDLTLENLHDYFK